MNPDEEVLLRGCIQVMNCERRHDRVPGPRKLCLRQIQGREMRPPLLGRPGETLASLREHRPCHVDERDVGSRMCREDPGGKETGARAEIQDSRCVATGEWQPLHHRLVEVVEARDELSARAVVVTRRRVECGLHLGGGKRVMGRAPSHCFEAYHPEEVAMGKGGALGRSAAQRRIPGCQRWVHSPFSRGLLPQDSLRSWEHEPHRPARGSRAACGRVPIVFAEWHVRCIEPEQQRQRRKAGEKP